MTRWNWKRWAFAIVTGAALAGSLSTLASDDRPKAGETITLKFPGQPDRVVTVVKSTRKPDGSLETEVKDGKTGDTFTLIDPAPENKLPSVVPAKPVASVPAPVPVSTSPIPPLPRPVATAPAKPVAPPAPLPPMPVTAVKPAAPVRPAPMSSFTDAPAIKSPMAGQTPMPPMADPKDKRLIGGGKLINREPEGPATTPTEEKRPGIIGRVFGKKPTPPVMPATSLPVPAPVTAPTIRPNAEPPRAQPTRPANVPVAPNRVVPPTPVVPPVSAPSAPDASPVPLPNKPVPPVAAPRIPAPLPVESIPVPAKPTLPPQPIPVPTIPSTPVTPAVDVKPATVPEVVKPAAHVPAASLESLAATLKDAAAPSARLRAAKQLATGPHASTDAGRTLLFHTAKTDLCPAVKADCIEHLSKLDCRGPAFVAFVKAACSDESGEVRLAAKSAMEKLAK